MKNPLTQLNSTSGSQRLGLLWIMVIMLALTALRPAGVAGQVADANGLERDGWDLVETDPILYYVQLSSDLTAEEFVAEYGDQAATGLEEILLFLNYGDPAQPVQIHVFSDIGAYQAQIETVERQEFEGVIAIADPPRASIYLPLDAFIALTGPEAENQLRHALSHIVAGWATAFQIQRGFDEGLAQYVERPNEPEQARLVALVQTAEQRSKLSSWSNLNRDVPLDDDDLVRAQSFSIISYMINHLGLTEFWQFLTEMRTAESWRDAMNVAFAPATYDSIERQWRDDVQIWAAGDWRWNLVAGFNLEPAHEQLERGNYEGATTALAISEQLLRDVNDPGRLAEVTTLKDQARIGELAESKMVEAQQALEQFVYDRAAAAVAQAEEQYEQLPPEVRPVELLATYREMAEQGLAATENLEIAQIQAGNWGDYPGARASALSAGESFSELGDAELRDQSASLIDRMDQEQLRLVLLLGALGLLTAAWLGLWIWTRGTRPLKWD